MERPHLFAKSEQALRPFTQRQRNEIIEKAETGQRFKPARQPVPRIAIDRAAGITRIF